MVQGRDRPPCGMAFDPNRSAVDTREAMAALRYSRGGPSPARATLNLHVLRQHSMPVQACLPFKISVALWPDSSLLPDRVKAFRAGASGNFWPHGGGQRMFSSLMLLAAEANGVVALRMMKLMRGGRSARHEANLMVSEKISAAFEATANLVAGASGNEIVHRYRQHVAKNAKRLSGRSRNRVLRRTRRRRK